MDENRDRYLANLKGLKAAIAEAARIARLTRRMTKDSAERIDLDSLEIEMNSMIRRIDRIGK